MQKYTHVLWDFNGTVLDDVRESVACAERLLRAHGLPALGSTEAYRQAFGFPIIDYYRRIGFDFSTLSYDALAVEWVAYYREATVTPRLYPDVRAALERLRERKIPQFILSATHLRLLEEQLEQLGIRHYFDELLALDNIHAHSKVERGIAWRREHPDARPLLVGDTDHDAETARAMGIDCILVTGGHQTRETLLGAHPLAVLEDRLAVTECLLHSEKM